MNEEIFNYIVRLYNTGDGVKSIANVMEKLSSKENNCMSYKQEENLKIIQLCEKIRKVVLEDNSLTQKEVKVILEVRYLKNGGILT